ncbi:MAG: hypothetical protein Kow0040_31910 [Thermogutta sp.]
MARSVYSRIQLQGTLVAQSPLHVGGHGEDVDTDLPLARDGAGQLYVPGTSLAGALRELAERLFGESVVDELWGYQDRDRGHASFVVVDDAEVEDSASVAVEIRDHVGIDREFGAAAEHIKYDRAVLPRGARMKLRLALDVPDEDQRTPALAMLAALRQAMEDGEVRLGAAKTRGLGHVRLEEGRLTECFLGSRVGILAALKRPGGEPVPQNDIDRAKQAYPPRKRPRLSLRIHWKPIGPFMVKAGYDGIAADMLPLLSAREGGMALVLPGSSIKGAFRDRAECIVRTVRGETRPKWLDKEGKKKFLDAVQVELVEYLFGAAKQRDQAPDLGLSALSVIDCFATQSVSVDHWQAVQAAGTDRELREFLDKAGLSHWSEAYHVAVDRWLGSAAESMLYTIVEPHRTEWEPLTLETDLRRLPDDLRLPAIALLLLVIRDLAQDRLPLGFATHRGMGAIKVTGLEIQGRDLEGDLENVSRVELRDGRFRNLPESLKTAWRRWATQEVPA